MKEEEKLPYKYSFYFYGFFNGFSNSVDDKAELY